MTRIWWQYDNGFQATRGRGVRKIPGYGHKFVDVTDEVAPTITTSGGSRFVIIEREPDPMARILVEVNDSYRKFYADLTDEPAPTILTDPPMMMIAEGESALPDPDKPAYRIPTMAEIAAVEPNGLKVASTFAGCGGSSLGYRMAGFRVIWANEFVPIAADTYRANMDPRTVLSTLDIRRLTGKAILGQCGLAEGELDVLDGSPPCQAFSTAGARHKKWGKGSTYEHGATQKNEEMFTDYIRLVREIRPKVFVAENVSGLIKGVSKGFFVEILRDLKACGYRVEVRTLDAQWLGVPQRRQRVIFLGVRDDLGLKPAFPKPLRYRYLLREVLPWITKAYSDFRGRYSNVSAGPDEPCMTVTSSGAHSHYVVEAETDISRFAIGDEWDRLKRGGEHSKKRFYSMELPDLDRPVPTITAMIGAVSAASVVHPTEKRKFSVAELKILCSFPADFELKGSFAQQCERLGNAVPPIMMRHIAETIRDRILAPDSAA